MSDATKPNMPDEQDEFVPHTRPHVMHHTSVRARRRVEPARMTLNLTSMIDVIFLLLIYFVVTASFTVGEGVITARLPVGPAKAEPQKKPPKQPLNIVLRSTPSGAGYIISIEGTGPLMNFGQLADELASLQLDPEHGRPNGFYEPDNPVLIKPDGDVRWQHVVNAFNAAVRARYSNIAFAKTAS